MARKAPAFLLGVAFVVAGVATWQNLITSPTASYAASPPDSCFVFSAGTITDYYNHEGNNAANPACTRAVTIPETIGGIPVVTIGSSAFQSNALTSLVIPDSVTTIGNWAFYNNELTSATISNSVTSIGYRTFSNNQLTSVTIPDSVTSIGDYALLSNQLTSITIPNSVTSIGQYAFYGSQLTSVTIPNSVTSIGSYAFHSNQLTSVTLLGTPSTMGNMIIDNNPIESVTHAGTVYSADDPMPVQCLTQTNGTITDYLYLDFALLVDSGIACLSRVADLPQSIAGVTITVIGSDAFYNNQLTSVTIPNSVTSIGDDAFYRNQLTSVTIPNSVTSIGRSAFYDNRLAAVTIPNSVTSIGSYAFFSNQLTSLTLGCGVTSLAYSLFSANKLTDVTIPDCITSIDPTIFFGQNPWGGTIEQGIDQDHYWYSSDQNVLQSVYDNIWYVRLHTENPSNPNNLQDSIVNENQYTGDLNGDGDGSDSIGGHLINPASVTARYVNGLGASLATDYNSTGRLGNDTNLAGYLVKDTPIPEIYDISSLTQEERAALDLAFAPYYRQGQTLTLNAPAIPGYTLQQPSSPYEARLIDATNLITFTYSAPSAPTQPPTSGGTSSGTSKPTTQRTTTAQRAAVAATEETPPVTIPDDPRTTIDFSAAIGSPTNPTLGAVPSDLAAIMTRSSFTVDAASSCHHINSAKLLPAANFTAPDADQTTLGGLAFVLDCQVTGGDANVTFALGDAITDLTTARVYKLNAQGVRTDITDDVTLSNRSSDSHTTISYTLTDGQSLDDDGLANGSISDPIYITVSHDTDSTVEPPATSSDKNGTYTLLFVGGAAVILIVTISLIAIRRRKTIG